MVECKEEISGFEFDEDLLDYVELDIDEVIKSCVLAHIVVKDFDEARTIVEDFYEIGPDQSEQFFDSFLGVILSISDYVDESINHIIDNAIDEVKTGQLKPVI